MHTVYILVGITTILSPTILSFWTDIKINIFNKQNEIETRFSNAVQEIEQSFDRELSAADDSGTVKQFIDIGSEAAGAAISSVLPGFGIIFGMVRSFVIGALEDQKWIAAVKQMIRTEIIFNNAINGVKDMNIAFKNIKDWMEFLNDKTNDNYNHNVNSIYRDLKTLIDKFSDRDSPYIQYPLVGAPFLIALSLAVAAFEPTAAEQLPNETKKFTLPCQAYDLLIDYRSYAVDNRLDKLFPREELLAVRNAPYSPNGYITLAHSECERYPKSEKDDCVVDQFATSNYCNSNLMCRRGYAEYVRHQVEKMFPVKQLEQACKKEWPDREPTGKNFQIELFFLQKKKIETS